jgi:hypothetical protein
MNPNDTHCILELNAQKLNGDYDVSNIQLYINGDNAPPQPLPFIKTANELLKKMWHNITSVPPLIHH